MRLLLTLCFNFVHLSGRALIALGFGCFCAKDHGVVVPHACPPTYTHAAGAVRPALQRAAPRARAADPDAVLQVVGGALLLGWPKGVRPRGGCGGDTLVARSACAVCALLRDASARVRCCVEAPAGGLPTATPAAARARHAQPRVVQVPDPRRERAAAADARKPLACGALAQGLGARRWAHRLLLLASPPLVAVA